MDDAPRVQALLDRRRKAGGVVTLPARAHEIGSTLRIPSGVTLRGVRPSPMARTGTWLGWAGAGEGPMLDLDAVQDATVEGIGLDGRHSGVTGIRVRSRNRPSTWGIILRDFAIDRCGVGIQWGDPGFPEGQADHSIVRDFAIWNCTRFGILVDSANSLTCSEVSGGQFLNNVLGHVGLMRSGPLRIACCVAGGANPSPFLSMLGLSGCTTVEMCQCEGQSHFLLADGGDDLYPLVLRSCHINNPVEVRGIKRVLGLGNYINAPIRLLHAGARWTGIEDRINPAAGGKVEGPGTFTNLRAPFASADDVGAGRGEVVLPNATGLRP